MNKNDPLALALGNNDTAKQRGRRVKKLTEVQLSTPAGVWICRFDHAEGLVINPIFNADDAARVFWEAVQRLAGKPLPPAPFHCYWEQVSTESGIKYRWWEDRNAGDQFDDLEFDELSRRIRYARHFSIPVHEGMPE